MTLTGEKTYFVISSKRTGLDSRTNGSKNWIRWHLLGRRLHLSFRPIGQDMIQGQMARRPDSMTLTREKTSFVFDSHRTGVDSRSNSLAARLDELTGEKNSFVFAFNQKRLDSKWNDSKAVLDYTLQDRTLFKVKLNYWRIRWHLQGRRPHLSLPPTGQVLTQGQMALSLDKMTLTGKKTSFDIASHWKGFDSISNGLKAGLHDTYIGEDLIRLYPRPDKTWLKV